jgi:drug/metabolite transporter (DMT)-like permease
MAVLLALSSALTYGIGDFFGGLATRRAPAAAVLLWSHVVGVVLLLGSVVVVTGDASSGDIALGAVGGLAGAAGVGLLYQALSIGPMSAVAPVTALLAAAVPVAAGFLQGERPGALALVGMAAGVAAIVLVSAEGGGSLRPSDLRAVAYALGAGLGFGLFFVALSYTDDGSGLWPLVGARAASVTVVGAAALVGTFDARIPRRGSAPPPTRPATSDARDGPASSHAVGEAADLRLPATPDAPDGPDRSPAVLGASPWLLTAGAGALDVAANVLYLLAIREGLLTIVSVLVALYPASTVVLAWILLHERFEPLQRVGLALAIPAAALMAA